MRSIQALQMEQILLVKSMQGSSTSASQGPMDSGGIITHSSSAAATPLQQGSLPQHGPSGSSGNNFPPASHLHDASVLSTSESVHRR
jgi:hypothetical protein